MINNINNNLIKELRRRTGISIIKCKQALVKTNGNIELAIDFMRKSGLKTDLIKSNRLTSSGVIIVRIASNKQTGLMIEMNCETDFVARNNLFQEFADTVITTALNESIDNIDILKTKFEEQRSILINKIGENIKIGRFIVLTGDFIGSYVHGARIGVMLSVSGKINQDILKNISMHIAARNPKYIYVDDISEDIMIRERHIQMDIAMRSEKSKDILEKIVKGRINKFMNEIVLTKQNFIMDVDRTVGSVLNEYSMKINNFVRLEIGDHN